MVSRDVVLPQELADAHTLLAQKYAGFLIGHPYRAEQQGVTITVDRSKPWPEPNVVADDCIFCVGLTDEEVERRVDGYQYELDIEGVRGKMSHYTTWAAAAGLDYIPTQESLRQFIAENQDVPRPAKEVGWRRDAQPLGWRTRPLELFRLPLRLKRKLCIEWNHLYIAWIEERWETAMDIILYDFDNHVFYHDVEEPDTEGC